MRRVLSWAWVSALVVGGLAPQSGGAQSVAPHLIASPPWDSASGGWAGRVVVLEHLTGLYCGPCHYLDMIETSLLQRYPATVLTSLAYHRDDDYSLHDPVSPDWEIYMRWYGNNATQWVPGCVPGPTTRCFALGQIRAPDTLSSVDGLVDGRGAIPIDSITKPLNAAGEEEHLYTLLVARIDAELRRPPEAFLHLQLQVRGGQLRVRVTIDSLTGRHPQLYLRLVLVEDSVTLHSPVLAKWGWWPGGTPIYHHVVYGFAQTQARLSREATPLQRMTQTLMGLPLSGPGTRAWTFDVAALQRRLWWLRQGDTLMVAQGLQGGRHGQWAAVNAQGADVSAFDGTDWLKDEYPRMLETLPDAQDWQLHPQQLQVVALVEDARSGEILQVATMPVDGTRLVLPTVQETLRSARLPRSSGRDPVPH